MQDNRSSSPYLGRPNSLEHLRGPMKSGLFLVLATTAALAACSDQPARTSAGTEQPAAAAPVLPSWNQGETRQSIVDFVERVTDPASPDYVAPPERIAVFDNDGNLWAEQPLYFQLLFALDRVRAMAGDHPEWAETEPFRAILENDREALAGIGEHELLQIIAVTHSGMTTDEFDAIVDDWLATATHPRFGVPKTYDLRIRGRIEGNEVKRVESGVWLSDGKTSASRIRIRKRGRQVSHVEVTLTEGRNRELRRMFAKLGHPVLSLRRIRIGNLTARGLRIGSWRKVSGKEIADLKAMASKKK